MNALLLACWNGHDHIISYLLSHGANIRDISEDGWTVLHFAVNKQRYDTVKLLLTQASLDINATDWASLYFIVL